MDLSQERKIIEDYINGYNALDIAAMTRDLARDIMFINVSEGQVNMEILKIQSGKIRKLTDISS